MVGFIMSMQRLPKNLYLLILCCIINSIIVAQSFAHSPRIFYVDSISGQDTNDGLSEQSAFRTTFHALDQDLMPGDSVLFKRSQIFAGDEAFITDSGTSEEPIHIGAYGEGKAPIIKNNTGDPYETAIWIIGDYITISDITVIDTNEYGLHIAGDYVTIENVEMYNVGIAIGVRGSYALIQNNNIHDLNIVISDSTPYNDYGAMGILINEGSNITIINNTFKNIIHSSIDYGVDGAALELFPDTPVGISDVEFSRNRIETCDNLFEVGSDRQRSLRNLYINHNIVSDCNGAMVIHALWSETGFSADVQEVYFDNNTIINTDIMWISDQSAIDTVFVRNNLFLYDAAPNASHNGYYQHQNNIYYAPDLNKEWQLGLELDRSESIIDPMIQPDYTLPANSPAVDAGTPAVTYPTTDFANLPFPQGVAPDIGAREFVGNKANQPCCISLPDN